MQWLKQLCTRRRRYEELSESIHEHLEEALADLMENGMTQADAERSARCDFGNPTLIEERSREIWQWSMFETTCADLGYAARKLRKSRAFTITCLLTLAWESALTLPYSAPPTRFSFILCRTGIRPPGSYLRGGHIRDG
jgi:hypothetical protein